MNNLLVATSLLLLSALLVGCGSPRIDVDDICSVYQGHPEWEQSAIEAEDRWGIPQEVVMAVIRHESSFVGDASAPRRRYLGFIPGGRLSSAYGFAQALDSTWDEYKQRTGSDKRRRHRFADAADFVGWYLNRAHRSLQISRDDGYRLYLAYHEGHRGFLSKKYENHPRLMEVASGVEKTQQSYQRQLRQCRPQSDSRKKREKRFTLKINEGLPN